MNRRKFLSWLAIAPVVAAAAPALKLLVPIEKAQDGYHTYVMGKDAVFDNFKDEPELKGWASYKFHMAVTLPPN